MNDDLQNAADRLESHSHVDNVRREPDGLEDCVFVHFDWVTESHNENGTRIIDDKEYDDHYRRVADCIRDCDGVESTRSMKSGLYGYTLVVEPERGW
jgi:hypothetical protein